MQLRRGMSKIGESLGRGFLCPPCGHSASSSVMSTMTTFVLSALSFFSTVSYYCLQWTNASWISDISCNSAFNCVVYVLPIFCANCVTNIAKSNHLCHFFDVSCIQILTKLCFRSWTTVIFNAFLFILCVQIWVLLSLSHMTGWLFSSKRLDNYDDFFPSHEAILWEDCVTLSGWCRKLTTNATSSTGILNCATRDVLGGVAQVPIHFACLRASVIW